MCVLLLLLSGSIIVVVDPPREPTLSGGASYSGMRIANGYLWLLMDTGSICTGSAMGSFYSSLTDRASPDAGTSSPKESVSSVSALLFHYYARAVTCCFYYEVTCYCCCAFNYCIAHANIYFSFKNMRLYFSLRGFWNFVLMSVTYGFVECYR